MTAKRRAAVAQSPPRKRILIIDDHPIMREGLAQWINHQEDLTVSGEVENARQAMEALAASIPDLVLADISLPDKSGLELIKDIQALHPGLPVLVISMHDETIYAERVLRAGGRGYIMKQEGGKRLMEAVRRVLGGQIYVSESMSAKILEGLSGQRPGQRAVGIEKLTDREFEVLELLGRGKATREIAAHLHLSVKTVEVHRLNIKTKLGLKSAAELIRFAVRWVETQATG